MHKLLLRIGFVFFLSTFIISLTSDVAIADELHEDTRYFSPPSNISLYNEKGKKTATLHKQKTTFIAHATKDEAFYSLQVGSTTYFVKTSDLKTIKSPSAPATAKQLQTITTKKNFKIYHTSSQKSTVLYTTTNGPMTFSMTDVKKGFVQVPFGDRFGYIAVSDLAQKFTESKQFIVAQTTPIYTTQNGKKIKIGIASEGSTWTIQKKTASKIYIATTRQKYWVDAKYTIATTTKATTTTAKKATYPVQLKATTTVTVHNKKGHALGTLYKGQSVALSTITNSKGVISFADQAGYVDLKHFKHSNIVQDGGAKISYNKYSYYLKVLAMLYPDFVEVQKIGQSVEGRGIYAYHLGKGKKEIYLDAATHAREYMTTNILMEMIDTYTTAYDQKQTIRSYKIRPLLDKTSIWFVPMVNPDGVMLVQQGLKSIQSKATQQNVIRYNGGSKDFNRYKANIRGVDLNRNYNVSWSTASSDQKTRNYKRYRGPSPASEPETKAMQNFVNSHHFKTFLAYHTSGQVLYWYYNQQGNKMNAHFSLVQKIRNVTGYSPIKEAYGGGSGEGADYFIKQTGNPGITVEIAPYAGLRPVPSNQFQSIWNKNITVPLLAAQEASTR